MWSVRASSTRGLKTWGSQYDSSSGGELLRDRDERAVDVPHRHADVVRGEQRHGRGAVGEGVVHVVQRLEQRVRLLFADPRRAHLPEEGHPVHQADRRRRLGEVGVEEVDEELRNLVQLVPAAVVRGEVDDHARDGGIAQSLELFQDVDRIENAEHRVVDERADRDLPRHRAVLRARGEMLVVVRLHRPQLGVGEIAAEIEVDLAFALP